MGSALYHNDSHLKIQQFACFLGIGRQTFSTEVFHFYLTALEKIQSSRVGINIGVENKSEIDVVPFLKAMDGVRMMFEEKIPIEAMARVRAEVERIAISKERVKVVDLDKLMDTVIATYLRFSFSLHPKVDAFFNSFTVSFKIIRSCSLDSS